MSEKDYQSLLRVCWSWKPVLWEEWSTLPGCSTLFHEAASTPQQEEFQNHKEKPVKLLPRDATGHAGKHLTRQAFPLSYLGSWPSRKNCRFRYEVELRKVISTWAWTYSWIHESRPSQRCHPNETNPSTSLRQDNRVRRKALDSLAIERLLTLYSKTLWFF